VAAVLHNCSQLRSLTVAGSSYMMANHDDAFLAVPGTPDPLSIPGMHPLGGTERRFAALMQVRAVRWRS
jgi:hypothetical protein